MISGVLGCQNDFNIIGNPLNEVRNSEISDLTGNVGSHEKILLKLFGESKEFKQLFYTRFADLLNTSFSCEKYE